MYISTKIQCKKGSVFIKYKYSCALLFKNMLFVKILNFILKKKLQYCYTKL